MLKSFSKDFEGRELTAVAIIVAALGSATLNVWGAFQIFPNPLTGGIFAVVISACEVIAAVSLRHIVADYQNNRFWKARLGALLFVMAVGGCVFSGKQAFHVLFLEANANHTALEVRSTARQAEADAYHAQMLLSDAALTVTRPKWARLQEQADAANLATLKSKPPHQAIVYLLLSLFEMVKIGGLFALATPSTKGRSKAQRKSDKRKQKIADAKSQREYEARISAMTEDDSNVVQMSA